MKKISTSLVASFFLATNLFSTDTLETITVTSATKTEQSIKDVTSNIDVITAEDIEARKFKTVVEALNSLSSVSVSNNGGIGQTTFVYLRGMDANRTLVLVDGIRFNDITTPKGSANIEHLMINDIERIEVIKGAQSSIWGADASAGVINIITKSAQKGTHGSASVEYGKYDSKISKANISHKADDFDAKLGVTRVDTDGFSAISPNKSSDAKKYEDDGYENTTANLKLGYNFDQNNRVSTSYEIIDTKVNLDDFFSKNPNNTDDANTKTHLANATYENKNDIATTKIYTNYTDIKRTYTNIFVPDYKGIVKEYGINTNIDYLSSSNIIIGADYKDFEDKKIVEDFTNQNKVKGYKNKGIFLANTNKLFDGKTIITEALRYDRYSDFDNKTTGKVGLKQYIVDELNLSTNYGTGYNVPNLYQLHDVWAGNEDLQPEKTKSYDVGLEYKGFSVTYFNNKIKNIIDYNYSTFSYDQMNGTSKIKGTEVAYKNAITEDLLLNLAYTNLSAKDENGNKLLNRPTNKFGFGVDYYGLKDFHFNVNSEYIGSRESVNYLTSTQRTKTGNYTIWNAVVDYDINKTFSTYVKLDNMFNKDYQIVDGYATSQRAAFVGLKASF
ncbi:TonB-dependent receptor plug domain-containing protein [Aliarcobacter butzleri]|uniref:TonB-dependent receptor plug domain-containing protein n=1 Tax=Aliarcobacter butzleri TaxID=28197 RepID=UPI0021B263FA|nr:TonB-dependent receptor [Aliarcobacter butzleri]MCT7626613.1 TonB-dependent receptor [Aliarcobacter butzleri]MCT7636174.1 TonB-dependent receptor [Aliarcobacter butzleri]MCT7642659.1 TonB-dependent receptor [Aliarcobacter butzleri]MDK2046004.1 TonB-dependent receptor [Aliarcobacter butzleri]MDN5044514.1 TonB-dependent receptor [Aliarcobacter butzleri]